MYVNGPGAVKSPEKAKKKNKSTTGSGFSDALNNVSDAASASSVAGAASISQVNSLFMLQEVGDERGAAQKALSHGHDILDVLNDIRLTLLTQDVSPSTLHNLQQKLEHWKGEYDDPKLQRIIGEIELRAAVELAKLSQA